MAKKLDLQKEEPLLIPDIPEGSNTLTSRALFYQRKLYEKVAFNSSLISNTKPVDFWYEKPFYGKSDTTYQAIHLSERFLKQLPVEGQNIFVLNFVADAFEDLSGFFNFLRSRGATNTTGPYAELIPTQGWTSVNVLYHRRMETLYQRFKRHITARDREKDIVDFDSFLRVFAEFVDASTPILSFTRSKFVLTNNTSPLISGLVIDLADSAISEDLPKVEEYLSDANFPIFKESAQRYGFKIDKHAPWRLIADIGSPAMQPYLERYGIKKETVLDTYFYKTRDYDIEALKSYVLEFYNSYVASKPVLVRPELCVKRDRVFVKTREITRAQQTQDTLNISDQIWLRLYTYIRAREENAEWDQVQFEKIVKDAYHYYYSKGEQTAISFIDRRTKIPSDSRVKQREFHFLNNILVA